MRRFISLFLCVLFAQVAIAQTKTTLIKGQIADESDAPIEYAAIVLKNESKAYLAGVISDEEGFFQMKGEFLGEYKLVISYIGYDNQEVEVVCDGKKTVDVGKIVMKELIHQIDEVYVTGEDVRCSRGEP